MATNTDKIKTTPRNRSRDSVTSAILSESPLFEDPVLEFDGHVWQSTSDPTVFEREDTLVNHAYALYAEHVASDNAMHAFYISPDDVGNEAYITYDWRGIEVDRTPSFDALTTHPLSYLVKEQDWFVNQGSQTLGDTVHSINGVQVVRPTNGLRLLAFPQGETEDEIARYCSLSREADTDIRYDGSWKSFEMAASRFVGRLETCSDYVTQKYKLWEKRGIMINNPCLRLAYEGAPVAHTQFVPLNVYTWTKEESYYDSVRGETLYKHCYTNLSRFSPYSWVTKVTTFMPIKALLGQGGTYHTWFNHAWELIDADTEEISDTVSQWRADLGTCCFSDFDSRSRELMTRALGAACEGQMEALITLVESKQTAELAIKLFRRISLLIKVTRRLSKVKKLSDARRVLKPLRKYIRMERVRNLASAWLELRFGWRQIWLDCHALTNAMKQANAASLRRSFSRDESVTFDSTVEPPREHTATLQSTYYAQMLGEQLIADNGGIASFTRSIGSNNTGRIGIEYYGYSRLYSGCGVTDPKSSDFHTAVNQIFGGFNLSKVWWETVRLSWIVDQFADLGSVFSVIGVSPDTFTRRWRTLEKPPVSAVDTTQKDTFVSLNLPDSIDIIPQVWDDGNLAIEDSGSPWRTLYEHADSQGYVHSIPLFVEWWGVSSVYLRTTPVDASLRDASMTIPLSRNMPKWASVADMVSVILSKKALR